MPDIVNLISLIVSVICGALGVFAIVVTWKLYEAGQRINMDVVNAVGKIQSSSHTAEITATEYTKRLVDGLIQTLQASVLSTT